MMIVMKEMVAAYKISVWVEIEMENGSGKILSHIQYR